MTLTDDEIRSLPERMGNWVTQDQCWGDLRALCEEVLRLRESVRDHVRELAKHCQPAPFMDGSRRVPPSIEKLLRQLESILPEAPHVD